MNIVLFTIFYATIFLCVCSYFIYPVIIWLAGRLIPFNVNTQSIFPMVSIVISAYNEEKNIEKKIQNTLAINYPKDKIEILIGSDGSTDGTSAAVSKFQEKHIKYFDFEVNRGKTAVQNDLVDKANGDILIFTDAASFLPKDAVEKLVRNFSDERVGCVAGKMRFVQTDTNLTTQSQGLYWRYEVALRRLESQIGSLIGVDGPLYAVRRDCYVPLGHHVISDLITPLLVLESRKKVVIEPDALVDEDPTKKSKQEFTTRRRITLRGLIGIASYLSLLNPFKHFLLTFQIIFHKILRWFVGPLAILNVVTCCFLFSYNIFIHIFILYIIFFFCAGVGWYIDRMGVKIKLLTIPYYFCLVNLAATMGIVDFFRRKQVVSWQPVRD